MSGIQFRDMTLKPRRNKQGQETFEGRVYYQGPLQMPSWPKVSFDLSRHETVFPPFDRRPIYHAYPDRLPDQAVVQTYSFPELLGEKLRALVERTRPRDLYDVVFIVENRRGEVDLTRTRELFVEKCRAKSITAPSPQQLLQLVRGSVNCARIGKACWRINFRNCRQSTQSWADWMGCSCGPARKGLRPRLPLRSK